MKGFESTEPEYIDEFFRERSKLFSENHISKTYVLLDDEEEDIVGFFSLSASRAKLDKRYKSGHAIMTSSKISEYPSIDLTFFAVNKKFQGKGYGAAMMDLVFEQVDKISRELGVTVLSLESLDRAVGFYLSRGFETYGLRSGGMRDQVPMSITIYEIQSLLSGA